MSRVLWHGVPQQVVVDAVQVPLQRQELVLRQADAVPRQPLQPRKQRVAQDQGVGGLSHAELRVIDCAQTLAAGVTQGLLLGAVCFEAVPQAVGATRARQVLAEKMAGGANLRIYVCI